MTSPPPDPRGIAFCSAGGPQVFSPVAYAHQVWTRDPFDVEEVHEEARRAFYRLLDGRRLDRGPASVERTGRILLIRGAAGAGKTHLIRAFRSHVHRAGLGFAGYMQMTSATSDYAQYTLTNLIDSLQRAYDSPQIDASGLMTLSDALAQLPGAIDPDQLAALVSGEAEGSDPVSPLVDQLLRHPRLSGSDPDVLRAILQLQRRDPPITARAVKYLRCQPLGDYDRSLLGGIADRTQDGDALRTIVELARLIEATSGGVLVLLVDQLEDIFHLGEAAERFPRAVDVLRSVVDGAPNVVVVISCLDDMYEQVRGSLSRPALDRLEADPLPVRLNAHRSLDEVEAIVARRLAVLYEAHEVVAVAEEPLFPFEPSALEPLRNLRTRDVINWCHEHQQRCMAAGRVLAPQQRISHPPSEPVQPAFNGAQYFNDARAAFTGLVPDQPNQLLALIESAAVQCDIEAGGEIGIQALRGEPGYLSLQLTPADGPSMTYGVGICNESALGGSLARRIDDVVATAAPHPPLLVRSGPFPDNPRTKIASRLGEVVRSGGRRVVIQESDWRTIMAFDAFRAAHSRAPGYAQWVRAERPLSQLSSLRALFQLDVTQPLHGAAPSQSLPRVSAPPEASLPPPARDLPARDAAVPPSVGTVRLGAADSGEVGIPLWSFAEHLGVVGINAVPTARHLLEQLVGADLPAVVVDRGGAWASYADPARGPAALPAGLPVDLFTPGAPAGRPMSVMLMPTMEGLRWAELPQLARQAAASLGSLMRYAGTARDQGRMTILVRAIQVLARNRRSVSLTAITELVQELDPELLHAVGHAKTQLYASLADHLVALAEEQAALVGAGASVLDVPALVGQGSRLSILHVGELDALQGEYWLSRFLAEMGAWCARQPEADELRAILVIDDAELWLPARAHTATQDPIRQLLRRGRAAGLGVVLVSRSAAELEISPQSVARWIVGPIEDAGGAERVHRGLARRMGNLAERASGLESHEALLVQDALVERVRLDGPQLAVETSEGGELLAWAAQT